MPGLKPLCFVLMPFGKKANPRAPTKPLIDFNAIYAQAIEPGIREAGLEPIRADQEETGGVIHKPMFERLLLCDFAVAELTVPNPNVFYELGVRHATRHNTTLPIFASRGELPFDVSLLRALQYDLGEDHSLSEAQALALRETLAKRLKTLRKIAREGDAADSPIFQLVSGTQQGSVPTDARLRRVRHTDTSLYELLSRYGGHEKTDVFRDVVAYDATRRSELTKARAIRDKVAAFAELERIRRDMGELDAVQTGVIVDLYLSYRALGTKEAWNAMIALYAAMPEVLKRSVLVREQLAFAMNRLAGSDPSRPELRDEAIRVLEEVTAEIGVTSETQGLLGRIYKDLWSRAKESAPVEALGHLQRSIDAYVLGFEADMRDAYPGINALTLLDVEGSAESRKKQAELLPIVRYAVERRMAATGGGDYWDHATLLELFVLGNDAKQADASLPRAVGLVREGWEAKTTADNLGFLLGPRKARGEAVGFLETIIGELENRAKR